MIAMPISGQWSFHVPVLVYVVLAVVALVGGFAVFFFAVCLWEKQHLSGRMEAAQQPFPYTPHPYWIRTRDEAARLGYWFAGDFATRKSASVVRGLESLFFTPDHLTLIAIYATPGGKMKKTVLRTRLENGKVIESADNPVTRDVTRVIESRPLLNAGLEELMGFHLLRVHHARCAAVPFKPDEALAEYERIQLERGQRLVAGRFARWINPEQTCLRLTVRGALAYLKDLFTQMGQLEDQQMRVDIKRAG